MVRALVVVICLLKQVLIRANFKALKIFIAIFALSMPFVSCGDSENDDYVFSDDETAQDDDASIEELKVVPITDEHGRTLILHGANYSGMEYGWFNHKPEDFEKMASWGFNAVRLPIAWSYIEPEKGVYDLTYLSDVVEPVVGYAYDAGLKVILDMHQWQWSPCCCGNGAPSWTCDSPNDGKCDWIREAQLFWQHPEYLNHFVEAWRKVAEFFAGDERIWAYDLWNEPHRGVLTFFLDEFENQLLRPLYARFIEAIRSVHPEPYILVEPSILHGSGFPFTMEPLPYERLIFSPHIYPMTVAVGGDYWFGPDLIERDIKRSLKEATEWGVPLLVGETGIVSSAGGAEFYARDASRLLDKYMTSFTWWAFGRGDTGFDLLDSTGNEKEIFIRYLSRPYPRVTSGKLRYFAFDFDSKEFIMIFDNAENMSPDVEIFIPQRHYPNGFIVDCSDAIGSWSWSFDSSLSVLTVKCNSAEQSHTIVVLPKN